MVTHQQAIKCNSDNIIAKIVFFGPTGVITE